MQTQYWTKHSISKKRLFNPIKAQGSLKAERTNSKACISGTCSFICQGISTRRQRRDLFGALVKLPPVTYLTTQRHSDKCLTQGHNKRTCRLFSLHYPFNAERQKQESCEYQLFKWFGMIWGGNRNQVYRLRGGSSEHYPNACVLKAKKTLLSLVKFHCHHGNLGLFCTFKHFETALAIT